LFFMKIGKGEITARVRKPVFSQASGEKTGYITRLAAEFQRGIPEWALPNALQVWPEASSMKPDGMPLEQWLCWFDTKAAQKNNGWSDAEREIVEAKLLGKWGVVKVEPIKVKAPYPKYVVHRKTQGQRTIAHAIKDILATYESAGFDVEQAILFERQNDANPDVIAALEGLLSPTEPDEELIAA
jgi:hypothetical protein